MQNNAMFPAAIALALIVGFGGGFLIWSGDSSEVNEPTSNASLKSSSKDKEHIRTLEDENTRLMGMVKKLKASENKGEAKPNPLQAEVENLRAENERLAGIEDERDQLQEEVDSNRKLVERVEKNRFAKALVSDTKTLADLKFVVNTVNQDWTSLGTNSLRMSEVMDDVAAMMTGAKTPDVELFREVQKLNGPIVDYALRTKLFVPSRSDGMLAAFTHPVSQIRMIEEALRMKGKALSESQSQQIDSLGEAYLAALAKSENGYTEESTQLQKIADEYKERVAFIREVRDHVVNQEQKSLLWGHNWVGHNSTDIYSPVIQFQQTPMTFSFEDTQEGKAAFRAHIVKLAGLGENTATQIQELTDAYIERFRPRLTPVSQTMLHFWHEDDLSLAFEAMLELQKKLLAYPSLSDEEKAKVREIALPVILRIQEN